MNLEEKWKKNSENWQKSEGNDSKGKRWRKILKEIKSEGKPKKGISRKAGERVDIVTSIH